MTGTVSGGRRAAGRPAGRVCNELWIFGFMDLWRSSVRAPARTSGRAGSARARTIYGSFSGGFGCHDTAHTCMDVIRLSLNRRWNPDLRSVVDLQTRERIGVSREAGERFGTARGDFLKSSTRQIKAAERALCSPWRAQDSRRKDFRSSRSGIAAGFHRFYPDERWILPRYHAGILILRFHSR